MKKTLLFLGLASVMSVFTACTQDDVQNSNGTPSVGKAPEVLVAHSAVVEDETRTAFDANEQIRWAAGDKLAVFAMDAAAAGGFNINYTLKPEFDGQKTGEFTPASVGYGISKISYFKETKVEGVTVVDKRYVAVYPQSGAKFGTLGNPAAPAAYQIGATIPVEQYYVEGSYDPEAVPMLAIFDDNEEGGFTPMKFKFIGAMLRLKVTSDIVDDEIDYINLSSTGAYEYLAGAPQVQFQSASMGITADNRYDYFEDQSKPIPLIDSKGANVFTSSVSQLAVNLWGPIAPDATTPTDIYFGIRAGNYSGFSIKINMMSGVTIEKMSKSGAKREVSCGSMVTLPVTNLSLPYAPEVDKNDDVITWTADDTYASAYTIQVYDEEKVVASAPLDATKTEISFDEVILPLLKKVTSFKPGVSKMLDLRVKADYKDKSIATAVYSVVSSFIYTPLVPELDVACLPSTQEPGAYRVQVKNYSQYENTITVVYQAGTLATAEDFTSPISMTYSWGYSSYASLPYETAYSFLITAKAGTTTKTKVLNFTTPKAPAAPALVINIEAEEFGGKTEGINLVGYRTIYNYYNPTLTKKVLRYKIDPTSMDDMVGAKEMTLNKGNESYMWNEVFGIWSDEAGADAIYDHDCHFQVVLEDPTLPGGKFESKVVAIFVDAE